MEKKRLQYFTENRIQNVFAHPSQRKSSGTIISEKRTEFSSRLEESGFLNLPDSEVIQRFLGLVTAGTVGQLASLRGVDSQQMFEKVRQLRVNSITKLEDLKNRTIAS